MKKWILKSEVDADVFLGGSFAKGTLTKSEDYDADIFVRFDWKYEDLSGPLEKILANVSKEVKINLEKVHGSRDYFKLSKGKLTFEIIPVLRVKKVREARNVTDLSYFHVNYIQRNANDKLKREIGLAKLFCKAQKVYGAESYIGGFSGYALECLIINYGSLEKMLKELVKIKERVILDPSKRYKRKADIFVELNESKLHSPVVLIDPTWKERNVLAALSNETFKKFQISAKKFLAKPSAKYFTKKELNVDKLKNVASRGGFEFVCVALESWKQEGDIAGTKMKKFSEFLVSEIRSRYEIKQKEFVYQGFGRCGNLYLIGKPKKNVVRIGPPLEMKKEVVKFKRANKKTFVKNGFVHSEIKVCGLAEFLEEFRKKNKDMIYDMGIEDLDITRT